MYDKCYFCLDQLPKLKKETTASFFVNFGGAGVQKSWPTLLYHLFYEYQNKKYETHSRFSHGEHTRYTPWLFATLKVDCKQILCDDGDDWPLSASAKSDSVDSV